VTRRSLLGTALSIGSLAAIVAVFVVPGSMKWALLVVALLVTAANIAHLFWSLSRQRRAAAAIVAAHPEKFGLVTGLVEHEGTSRSDRARVVAVLADRDGLSFRDSSDAEVVQVAASRIMSLELAPHEPRARFRPAHVKLIDGPPVAFWVGADQDRQAETIVALRSALGRAH
jgi:hypothetical protein